MKEIKCSKIPPRNNYYELIVLLSLLYINRTLNALLYFIIYVCTII